MSEIEQFHKELQEAVNYIKSKIDFTPSVGIILGTGLGSLVDGIELVGSVEYDDIPNFPVSTVESHHGRLLFGNLRGKKVVCMQGRFHFYEGYSFKQIVFPVRVMKALGMETIIVSNAAGGLNPKFSAGDVMLITDHINFFPGNPLIGLNDNKMGPRFPDMYEVYNKKFIALAKDIALKQCCCDRTLP